jgi:acetolactate synthase-1/2/3 large subunit
MKKSGAWLAVYALEQVGIRWTFGVPGVHTIELYDELNKSESIAPVLVTHEQCGAFMADAISRTSDSVGCLTIVPAAGMTHAMSGIGEAFLDGIPMLVISGGIRRDSGRSYQLHELDQLKIVEGITKGAFLISAHEDVIPTIFKAYELATSGEPGPVFVELAADVQMSTAEVGKLPTYQPSWKPPTPDSDLVSQAAELLRDAKKPGIYVGWGAVDATQPMQEIAELLGAPVSTTMQGLSSFPADHPLHTGFGFGPSAVPAAQKAFADCDVLLAVGCRFAELATGSYGMPIPEGLIHVDINPKVFGANYPAQVAIEADATQAAQALLEALRAAGVTARESTALEATIAQEKKAFFASWTAKPNAERVSPGIFFRELRQRLDPEAFLVVDDGNHTFLAAEQYPVLRPRRAISPTDFNCMGYAVPATIATKLANPDQQVVGVIGDGAFVMTALEILTATANQLGAIFCVFHDGELAQISQFQTVPMNRKTCTVLPQVDFAGVATATGAAYLAMDHDGQVGDVLDEALKTAATGRPVLVDVKIDYSRKTAFTKGVVKVNLGRFPLGQKVRFVGRAIKRHILG